MSIKSTILLQPILSEKSTELSSTLNKHVFRVEKNANKLEIKKAVEKRFNVRVKKVATLRVKGKQKSVTIRSNDRILRTTGNQASWKKAIVTLEEGHIIDIVGGEV
ncbi:MAG: 50S ribosomal protein L23 [FCB group bacterium]|nr:50S ribosomal protein L23 [FCB group bacterium]